MFEHFFANRISETQTPGILFPNYELIYDAANHEKRKKIIKNGFREVVPLGVETGG